MIAEFALIYRFTGFFIRLAGPIRGAGRNREKPYEKHEARHARHHAARLKHARGHHWGRDIRHEPKLLGKVVIAASTGKSHVDGDFEQS